MPLFTVEARDAQGRNITQVREAASQADVVAEFRNAGYTVLSVKGETTQISSEAKPGQTIKPEGLFAKPRLPVKSLAQFCRQLSVMIKAGMSLVGGLETIRDEQESEYFKTILTRVIHDIEAGAHLAEAMGKFSHAFSPMFVSMVEAGETSGSLEQILEQMGIFFERRYDLQKTIKTATAYPKFVAGFFCIMLIGIFGWLVPQFEKLFQKYGADLPPLTKLLIFGSELIRNYFFITIPVVLAGVIGFIMWKKSAQGKLALDRLYLKLPLFGKLAVMANTSRFAMTLGILVRNGVTLDHSLEITSKTMENQIFEEGILSVRTNVVEGNTLYKSMVSVEIFPQLTTKMVKVGEESGALPEMLHEVTSYYEGEVHSKVKQVATMVEPAMIMLLGVVVLIVLLGLYLPIFEISQHAGNAAG